MKKNNTISLVVFSYLISVLLIFPFFKQLINYYEISIFLSIFVYSLTALLLNSILYFLNVKYTVFKKILNISFFQYYFILMMTLENLIRKNAFLFGIILSASCGAFFHLIFTSEFIYSQFWVPIYYFFMVYIKVRLSLINHKLLSLDVKSFLK